MSAYKCLVHGIPDCSPLLNGCDIPNMRARMHDAFVHVAARRMTAGETLSMLDHFTARVAGIVERAALERERDDAP